MAAATACHDALAYTPSWSEYREIRGVRYHVRQWGKAGAPKVFLFHGWMDVSATWQFLVDELIAQSSQNWHFIAPDWSGYGLSAPRPGGSLFIGYLADMEQLVKAYCGDEQQVKIIGHSMGANLSSMYSGARPDRVSHFVNIEGLAPMPGGLLSSGVPKSVARWLDGPRGISKSYQSHSEFAARLVERNPRLRPEWAAFLAEHFLGVLADGSLAPLADAESRQITPIYPHYEQVEELLRNIRAKVLLCRGLKSFVADIFAKDSAALASRLKCYQHRSDLVLEDASHNLHHEFPERVAADVLALFSQ
ncbi:MAG: alpha/beta hydrolase [Zhongshania sp.]|uniref:alpha/beta fold hydrolase n=1 Tax=Zhongshania sp. TaxID=1971902 RepID=UPI00261DF549|nr:alpha/beta hydrolase [Zhongshania sp.]MDF1691402.1 alpha/beta hydrolase [Zhongshania sp.]